MNKHHKDEEKKPNICQKTIVQKGALNIYFPAEITIISDNPRKTSGGF